MEPVEQFVAAMLTAAKLDALPADAKAELVARLRVQVEQRIGLIAMAHLDPAGIEAYTAMLEQQPAPSSETMTVFFSDRIPDFATKLRAGLDAFAAEFVAAAQ